MHTHTGIELLGHGFYELFILVKKHGGDKVEKLSNIFFLYFQKK